MQTLIPLTEEDRDKLVSRRSGETKLGQEVKLATDPEKNLRDHGIEIVILGIPEDIGPRANLGLSGAAEAWKVSLSRFLNIQNNAFLKGDSILIAGHIYCEDLQKKANELSKHKESDLEHLRQLVSELDSRVSDTIRMIRDQKKLVIAVGGGHNNSYGLLKGSSLAAGHAINCINLDPHADFRPMEGRHSGNGFSYAKHEGYLNKYSVLGLHESYNSGFILNEADRGLFDFVTYDAIIRGETRFEEALNALLQPLSGLPAGIEIDLDSIENMPTSASSPSGVSAAQARAFLHASILTTNPEYIHLAEGAPTLHTDGNMIVGKMNAYLMADACKSYLKKLS